jgi:hypothetical protein
VLVRAVAGVGRFVRFGSTPAPWRCALPECHHTATAITRDGR